MASIGMSNKSGKQVEDRYWEHYMGRYGYCLPSKTMTVDGALADTASILLSQYGSTELMEVAIKSAHAADQPSTRLYQLGEEVVRDRMKDGGKANDIRDRIAQLPGGDLVGYMPLREVLLFPAFVIVQLTTYDA
jgi:hypothetical protein